MNFFLMMLWCLVGSFTFLEAKDVDVILIGGQSNATGQGRVSNLPAQFKADSRVKIFYSKYLNQGKNANQWLDLCPAAESQDRFGVELSLGTALQKRFPQKNIALIKHGLSGSNLFQQWNPGEKEGKGQGPEYVKFMETVKAGMDALKKQGDSPVIRGMIWQQGEADARDNAGMERSRAYAKNLKRFIERVREDIGVPDMLFIYGTVMPLAAPRFPGRDVVKQAQRDVVEKSGKGESVSKAILVEADDLQMLHADFRTPAPRDDVHLGTFGILNLGERFAKALYPFFLKN